MSMSDRTADALIKLVCYEAEKDQDLLAVILQGDDLAPHIRERLQDSYNELLELRTNLVESLKADEPDGPPKVRPNRN
jgi:hypothetical protein